MNKIASVLAFVIGAMAVFAGGQVLLGKVPDYTVIDWLPVYNVSIGVLSVFVTAVLIWRQSAYALPSSIATFSVHAIVMIVLQTVYRNVVAIDSLTAMTLRLIVWLVILTLLFLQLRKQRVAAI